MSRQYTEEILGTECIGDSLGKINTNFLNLDETTSTLLTAVTSLPEVLPTVTNYLSTETVLVSTLSVKNINIVSVENLFALQTITNLVSALAINIDNNILYIPLVSAI